MSPVLRRFEVGDYVYYRNTTARTSLEATARPDIYRVIEARPSGVLVLEAAAVAGSVSSSTLAPDPSNVLGRG
ncbi:hypothetical protein CHLRE_05g234650v5 [Chlamydomonas reinhardtii]|uniref:Uncharacterized protein n=1 Tax=Chlamydomonas reinhardtii TaxID=3055 RepID=A0A2K3DSQ9_CHLRE|nr:uncharacterized protein CHLRE_05g234650v5 [Chlamydomonas reinhardtii]PNW83557.1 hypothetical protein CHLRE_05g234650v5 [Chlamydomonas reinhardtii]